MGAATVSVDEFQALEQKVLQTVELVKMERAARAAFEAEAVESRARIAAAEAEIAELTQRLAAASNAQAELEACERERNAVRQRVEKMLATMEEIL
jgi:uncharacterized protein involved in exopolysaccharide biosynthesis